MTEASMTIQCEYLNNHVLVIDDMASTRALLRDMLLNLGFQNISMARSAYDALRKVDDTSIDLIISDQVMDGMSGTELLHELRSRTDCSHIPFIMVSSLRDAPSIDCALTLGVDDYIAKPISMGLLGRKIEDVLRRRTSTMSA